MKARQIIRLSGILLGLNSTLEVKIVSRRAGEFYRKVDGDDFSLALWTLQNGVPRYVSPSLP